MAPAIYTLCALTAFACAFLLLRGYRRTRSRLQLWSGLCFCGMFINNLLLVLDHIVFPQYDMLTLRLFVGLIALIPLIYGLVWEED